MANLCKDCLHYHGASNASADVCTCPAVQPAADLVRGEKQITYCYNQRSLGFKCGPDGKHWEAK